MDKESTQHETTPEQEHMHMPAVRQHLTFGQRASDRMTSLLGSWFFLINFAIFLIIWITINAVSVALRWDPYPFILLNLALSCLAATQAPIIMMSQNRQAERDRVMSKYDYAVNRKAEREIEDIQEDLEKIKEMLARLEKK